MKKVLILLTTIIPVVVLSILATIILPMFFGQAMKGILPIIMIIFALATIGITILVKLKKRNKSRVK